MSELVAFQRSNLTVWYLDDKKFTKHLIVDQDFKRASDKHLWEYANFNTGNSSEFPEPRIGKNF